MVKVCLFVADGSDEIEFSAPYGIFTRANTPIDTVYVGDNKDRLVNMSRGIQLYAKRSLSEFQSTEEFVKEYDVAIIPGGWQGSLTLSGNKKVQEIVKEMYNKPGKWVAMICAGSLTAKTSGLGVKTLTSHPCITKDLQEAGYEWKNESVVVTDNLITSQGPGTAMLFALKIAEQVLDKDTYQKVYDSLEMP
ncbi:ThiJ domain-containing protein [Schizosaccharomyces japonicus yFS275]|uniref:D-lactate dehydratase n=1 Tax=Schizosaccharomyces japonicus (strain yFS275 / FY16936) TaxID=402676 RepID=B6K6R6_SCHJY|nr:ThiJ domain-containing protein [Schizosaccharomyces japonicus yFS275]EEB09220.1 ThiJ domain-containing protein [Schizosaccharomyces japonicus yFS275]